MRPKDAHLSDEAHARGGSAVKWRSIKRHSGGTQAAFGWRSDGHQTARSTLTLATARQRTMPTSSKVRVHSPVNEKGGQTSAVNKKGKAEDVIEEGESARALLQLRP